MQTRRSPIYRGFLVLASLALLAVAAFLGWKIFGPKAQYEKRMAAAEEAYARGLPLLEKGDPKAVEAFDEAVRECIPALQESDAKIKKEGESAETPERGKLVWLFARALRERAFAKAIAAGKPIDLTFDSTAQENYRLYLKIPDEHDRKNAILAVREAARLLPDDLTVQTDAFRSEIALGKIDWPVIVSICERIVALEPNDARANYFLAINDFEQFDKTGKPLDAEKKDAARMVRAQKYLEKSRASGKAPPWRTLGLDLLISKWLAENQKDQKALAHIESLLFDPKEGVEALSSRPDSYKALSRYDIVGVMQAHTSAAELAEKSRPGELPGVLASFVKAATLCLDLAHGEAAGIILTSAAIQAADKNLDRWKNLPNRSELLDSLTALASKSIAEDDARAVDLRRIAEMLAIDPARKTRAIEFLAEALKLKPDKAESLAIHLQALKLKAGGSEEEQRPHLTVLMKSTSPEAQGTAAYFDALLAIEAGNLDLARRRLQEVLRRPEAGEYALRAFVMLPDLHLAQSRLTEAAVYVRELEKGFPRLAAAPAGTKEWALDYVRSQAEATALIASTQFALACEKIERFRKDNPDKPLPADFIRVYEDAGNRALEKLKDKSDANRMARIGKYRLFLLTLPGAAKSELNALLGDYPNDPALLRLAFDSKDVGTPAELDAKVKEVAKSKDRELFWIEWLFASGRSKEAREALGKMTSPEAKSLAKFLGAFKLSDRSAARVAQAFVHDPGAFHHERELNAAIRKGVIESAAGHKKAAQAAFKRVAPYSACGTLTKEIASQL